MIQKVVKGSSPSLADTAKANEVIDALNKLQGLTVAVNLITSAESNGSLKVADGNVVLELNLNLNSFPKPPAAGTYGPLAIDGVVTWVLAEECEAPA